MEELNDLKEEIKELKEKLSSINMDLTHMKATTIISARMLEDSVLNRGLLNEILKNLEAMSKLSNISLDEAIKLKAEQTNNLDTIGNIIGYLKCGQKIHAIKALRQASNLGLKDAKDVIDMLDVKLKYTPTLDDLPF